MAETRVDLSVEGPVAIVTLARGDKLNALDTGMLERIEAVCDEIERNEAVRVAILTGAGDRAFSAGGDIEAWADLDPLAFGRHWIRYGHRVFDRLARLRQPLIAVLNGHAFGGGLELAGVADLRVAEAHAKLGLPETGLAMVPGWSGTQRLVRRFGAGIVRRMALGGEIFVAQEALALGLVDAVVPTGTGLDRAREMAARVAARGPAAVQIAKQMISAAEGEETAGALESIAGALVATTKDLQEGVASFREKRTPRFEDR